MSRTDQLAIRQRIERLAESRIPVCLWQVGQFRDPSDLIVPGVSLFDLRMMYGTLPDAKVRRVNDALHLSIARADASKFATEREQRWMAVRTDTSLVAQQTLVDETFGIAPDGAMHIGLFPSSMGGFVRVHSLSVEAALPPGRVLESTILFSLETLPVDISVEALVDRVPELLGLPLQNP